MKDPLLTEKIKEIFGNNLIIEAWTDEPYEISEPGNYNLIDYNTTIFIKFSNKRIISFSVTQIGIITKI